MLSLEAEGSRLLDFAEASVHPAGFSWLDDRGRPDLSRGIHTWITARMTYSFALAAVQGRPGAAGIAAHGVSALLGPLHDREYGGWHAELAADGSHLADGSAVADGGKQAYAHAFVVLAAGAAVVAEVPAATDLLEQALEVVSERFLDDAGRVVDGYDRRFGTAEDYRGANSSMHMVEALLLAGDVRQQPGWHELAFGIAEHLIHDVARDYGFRLPEHFGPDWVPLPAYNRDRPFDQFRPYGSTPGHLLEWSRLLLQLEAVLPSAPAWMADDAAALFEVAVRTGWSVDGAPGFVYTADFDDTPVARARMHWVHAEATAAAAALHRRTGKPEYDAWYRSWWDFTERFLVDRRHGSWHHELDASNRPSAQVWSGKPDVYHAYQATLLPRVPLAPSLPLALAAAERSR